MKRICMGLAAALAFAVLWTATVAAQSAPGRALVDVDNNGRLDVSVVLPGERQEEVEILRRLLDKSFTAVYGSPITPGGAVFYNGMGAGMSGMGAAMGAGMPFGPYSRGERPAPDLEGVYLKDYGVVYTVTLPPPPNGMLPGPTAGVVTHTQLSPWERTRKELRGEKIEDEGKAVSGSPSLSEVILKVLADNGKHFTRLAEGERITVVVTFRDDAANGIFHPQSPGGSGGFSMPGMSPGGGSPRGSSQPRMASPGEALQYVPPGAPVGGKYFDSLLTESIPPAPKDDAPWLTDVRNGLKLGDLHVKQQNYPAAISAYKNAQEVMTKVFRGPGKIMSQADAANVLPSALLYLQLAKGYESAGDNDASRKATLEASEMLKMAANVVSNASFTAKAQPPAPTPPPLPSKLVVTASKKLLDEVGSGKTSFEAFCKAATVESVKPPTAEKK